MTQPSSTSSRPRAGWWIMLVLALLMVVLASQYVALDPNTYFSQQRTVHIANTLALMLHIVGATLATLLGTFQFLAGLR
jgi:uncharacterized integral membrane protein